MFNFKALLLILVSLTVLNPKSGQSKEVEYEEYEITLNIEASGYEDSHDATNEYKVGFDLLKINGGYLLGSLNGSTADNIHQYLTGYQTVEVGDNKDFKTRVLLPKKTIAKTFFRVSVLEADFTVPVPGPCCININDDDRIVFEEMVISETEKSLVTESEHTRAHLSIVKVGEGMMDINEIKKLQSDKFINGGFFSSSWKRLSLLQNFIDDTN